MATSVISISFDQENFKTERDCEEWIANQQSLCSLLSLRGWKLKTIACYRPMGIEGRKVFHFENNSWAAKNIIVDRPNPYIRIETRVSSDMFTPTDVPPLSEKALKNKRKRDEKNEEKNRNREERKEKAAIQRKIKAFSTKEGIPIEEVGWDNHKKVCIRVIPGTQVNLHKGGKIKPKKRQKKNQRDELHTVSFPEMPEGTLSFVVPPQLIGSNLSPHSK